MEFNQKSEVIDPSKLTISPRISGNIGFIASTYSLRLGNVPFVAIYSRVGLKKFWKSYLEAAKLGLSRVIVTKETYSVPNEIRSGMSRKIF